MRRILSAIVTVLGLVAIALAVCSATIWKPSSTVEASLAQSPNQPYVITEPGVLGTLGSDVTVTATAPDGQEVRVIVARATDVHAWLDLDPYVSVTGVSSDNVLDAQEVTEKCETADGATADPAEQGGQGGCTPREATGGNPADSDLWITEHTGTGSVTFEQSASDAQVVVMAVTDGTADAPNLTLSWPRTVATPWYFYAGLVLGALLLMMGVSLFLLDVQMRHAEAQRRSRAAERAARVAQADGVTTASIPQLDDPNRKLTRRELREKERAESAGEEWIDPRTGRVYRGGVEVPDVPSAPAETGAQEVNSAWQPGAAAGLPGALDAQGSEPVAGDAGVARGSAVLPGLDEATTQAHRASRDLSGEPTFSVAATDSTGSMEASTAEVPAFDDAADHSRFAPSWQSGASGAGRPGDMPLPQASPAGGFGEAPTDAFQSPVAHSPVAEPAQFGQPAQQDPAQSWGQQDSTQAWGQQVPSSWDQDLGAQAPQATAQTGFTSAASAGDSGEATATLAGGPGWPQQAQPAWGEQPQQPVPPTWGQPSAPSAEAAQHSTAAESSAFASPVGLDAAGYGADHGAPIAPGLQAPGTPVESTAPAYPAAPAAATGDAWTMPGASDLSTAQSAGYAAGQHWPAAQGASAQEAAHDSTHGRHALQEAPDFGIPAETPGAHAAPATHTSHAASAPSAPAAPAVPTPHAASAPAAPGYGAADTAAAGYGTGVEHAAGAGVPTGTPAGAPAAPANPYLNIAATGTPVTETPAPETTSSMGPGTTGMMGPGTTGLLGPGTTSAPPAAPVQSSAPTAPAQPWAPTAAPAAPAAPAGTAAGGAQVEDYRVSDAEIQAANAVPLTNENPTDKERS